MVGAQAGVFRDAAAEFGEHQGRNLVPAADAAQVVHEAAQRVRGVSEQAEVQVVLVDVGVEDVAGVADVVQPGGHASVNKRRDLAQVQPQPRGAHAVIDRGAVVGPRLPHERGAFGRALRQAGQEPQRRVVGVPHVAQAREQRLLPMHAVAFEAFQIGEDQGRVLAAAHGQRLRRGDVDQIVAPRVRVERIGQPSQPAQLFAGVRAAGVPETHGGEVRQRRVVVPAGVHDRQVAVLVQALEPGHGRMQAEMVGQRTYLFAGNADRGPFPVIDVVAVRHHGIEPVVAARQFDHDQNPFGVGMPGRGVLRGPRRGRPHAQQSGT